MCVCVEIIAQGTDTVGKDWFWRNEIGKGMLPRWQAEESSTTLK